MSHEYPESAKELYRNAWVFYDQKSKNDLLETCHLLFSNFPNSKEANWAVSNFKIKPDDANAWAIQIQNIRSKLEPKTSDELLKIWEECDKSEHTDSKIFVAVKQLLMARGALPTVNSGASVNNVDIARIMTPEDRQGRLIGELHKKTGLSIEECRNAVLSSQGDGDKLSRLIEQKTQAKAGPVLRSLGKGTVFILTRLLYRTLTFGVLLSVLILVLGVGFKGATLSDVLNTIPYCFAFAFMVAVIFVFSKDF